MIMKEVDRRVKAVIKRRMVRKMLSEQKVLRK